MKIPAFRASRLVWLLLALLSCAPAWAQTPAAPTLPAADRQTIKAYTLNEDVFNRLVATINDGHEQNIKPQNRADPSTIHSLDDLSQAMVSADPRIAPLLKKHGFTPREFLLANLAMSNAALSVMAEQQPAMAKYVDASTLNPANVSFYKAHQAQIQQLMQQAAKDAGAQGGQP